MTYLLTLSNVHNDDTSLTNEIKIGKAARLRFSDEVRPLKIPTKDGGYTLLFDAERNGKESFYNVGLPTERYLSNCPESATLIVVSADGRISARGGVTGISAVFYSSQDGNVFVSDKPEMLASLVDAPLDIDEITIRLSDAEMIYPFHTGVVWSGVTMVPPGSEFVHDKQGFYVRRWWRDPEADLSLEEAASQIRGSLRSNLSELIQDGKSVISDLSGGLDSSTITYWVGEYGIPFDAFTIRSTDPANTDIEWAVRAARDIGCNHHVLDQKDVWAYHESGASNRFHALPEGPSEAERFLPLINLLQDRFADPRGTVHLNGQGGDELFGFIPAIPWSLNRSKGRRAKLEAWRIARANKLTSRETLCVLTESRTPAEDLVELSKSGLDGREPVRALEPRWIPPRKLPSFATEEARERFRAKCVEYAKMGLGDLMLHEDRVKHQIKDNLMFHGALMRRANKMLPVASGLTTRALYLDQQIIAASLSLSANDRIGGGCIKPVLARARPSSMPEEFFKRVDKGEYSSATFDEFRTLKSEIIEDFSQGSILSEIGLIDIDELFRVLNGFSADGLEFDELIKAHRVEKWVRSYRNSSFVTQ